MKTTMKGKAATTIHVPPGHPEVTVRVGEQSAQIDEGMAELIAACWRAEIETMSCCQEAEPGLASVSFLTLTDMEAFFDAVSDPETEDALFYESEWQWDLWVDGGLRGDVTIPCDQVAWAAARVERWRESEPWKASS
jgi:hypothetical protein